MLGAVRHLDRLQDVAAGQGEYLVNQDRGGDAEGPIDQRIVEHHRIGAVGGRGDAIGTDAVRRKLGDPGGDNVGRAIIDAPAQEQIARREKRNFAGTGQRPAQSRGGEQGDGKADVEWRTSAQRTRSFGDHVFLSQSTKLRDTGKRRRPHEVRWRTLLSPCYKNANDLRKLLKSL